MKMVYLVWSDAADCDVGPWVDRATAAEPAEVIFHQIGFLYQLTPDAVVVTACVGEHQMGPRTRIPAAMVRSLTELISGEVIAIPKRKRK